MKTILFATTNKHKLSEATSILAPLGIHVEGAPPLEVDESAPTFEGNAEKKAREYALHYQSYCLADDSGLSVAALRGLPGVFSARFSALRIDWSNYSVEAVTEQKCSDQDNNALLIKLLENKPDRTGAYVCAVSLAAPSGEILFTERGECSLTIIDTPRGSGGFGYDPFCIPQEGDFGERTFAELTLDEKNSISHRGKAFRKLAARIVST